MAEEQQTHFCVPHHTTGGQLNPKNTVPLFVNHTPPKSWGSCEGFFQIQYHRLAVGIVGMAGGEQAVEEQRRGRGLTEMDVNTHRYRIVFSLFEPWPTVASARSLDDLRGAWAMLHTALVPMLKDLSPATDTERSIQTSERMLQMTYDFTMQRLMSQLQSVQARLQDCDLFVIERTSSNVLWEAIAPLLTALAENKELDLTRRVLLECVLHELRERDRRVARAAAQNDFSAFDELFVRPSPPVRPPSTEGEGERSSIMDALRKALAENRRFIEPDDS